MSNNPSSNKKPEDALKKDIWTWLSLIFVLLVAGGFVYVEYLGPPSFLAKWQSHKQPAKKHQGAANRLANAPSPYLRQHAHNPVDWYPWGPEAFKKAKRENKPVFLSVGYSTCHWCHVMEKESFSDMGIADLLNTHFIAIKVDRERRPDLDETYMLATELLTKSGGWPNSVFLRPDKKPFFAGGYFPKDVFAKLLKDIHTGWQGEKRGKIDETAESLAAAVQRLMTIRTEAVPLTQKRLEKARTNILKPFDSFNGGFNTAPKFPQETILALLGRLSIIDADKAAEDALLLTLDHILKGGIHDQLGGGFHRYAIDNDWMIPHFEKMLYTQAQLTGVLLEAHRLTGLPRYGLGASAAFDFVLRDMTAPGGGFYSAFDADSKKTDGTVHEGAYYIWTPEELEQVLGAKDAAFAAALFGVTPDGNFEGTSILHLPEPPMDLARRLKLSLPDFTRQAVRVHQKLLQARGQRPQPLLDKKIITAWNGLMIESLARAAGVLQAPHYLRAAKKSAKFIHKKMMTSDGDLMRIYFENKAGTAAQLDDYAALALADLALFDATKNLIWLRRAKHLATKIRDNFHDKEAGDYFMTAAQDGFGRSKQRSDSTLPSGNAMVLRLFSKLFRRTGELYYRNQAEALGASLSGLSFLAPAGHAAALQALDTFHRGESSKIRFAGKGAIRAKIQKTGKANKVSLRIELAPGWHLNANKPLEKFLIPTKLALRRLNRKKGRKLSVRYPAPVTRKLSFNKKPLALLEGKFSITARLPSGFKPGDRLVLTAQPCSDKLCLSPETLVFLP